MTQPAIANSSQYLPMHIAIEEGLFEKYGIELELVDAKSSVAISLFLSGRFKLGLLDPGGVGSALASGTPIKLLAVPYTTPAGYTFFVTPEIKSWADLEGKKVGISGPNGLPDITAHRALEQHGVDVSKVTFQALGGVTAIPTAMIGGAVQGGAMGAPSTFQAEKAGLKNVWNSIDDEEFVVIGTPIIVDPEWADAHETVVENWLKAYTEAVWIMVNEPAEAARIFAKVSGLDPSKDKEAITRSIQNVASVIRRPDTMGDNDPYYQGVKNQFPEPDQIKDVSLLKPDTNYMEKITESGLADEMEEKYGAWSPPTDNGLPAVTQMPDE